MLKLIARNHFNTVSPEARPDYSSLNYHHPNVSSWKALWLYFYSVVLLWHHHRRCQLISRRCPCTHPSLPGYCSVDARHHLTYRSRTTSHPHCGFGIGKTTMVGRNTLKRKWAIEEETSNAFHSWGPARFSIQISVTRSFCKFLFLWYVQGPVLHTKSAVNGFLFKWVSVIDNSMHNRVWWMRHYWREWRCFWKNIRPKTLCFSLFLAVFWD